MAIAGRVAIVPKGEWSQDINYDKLDLVTHNGNAFIAYKPSVGVEPVDGDTWMLIMESISTDDVNKLKEDVEAILNGTTPVGDSLKLGGKGASEYALVDDLSEHNYPAITLSTVEEVDVFFNTVSANMNAGTSYRRRVYVEVGGHNRFPSGIYELFGYFHNEYYQYQIVIGYFGKKFYRDKAGSAWEEWKVDATTADLANYLPLSAKPTGTYTGNGSATARTINTGGTGNWIAIYGANYMILVSVDGAIYHAQNSESVQALPTTKINFINGNLTIASDSEVVNSNGRTYTYQVL